MNLDIEDKLIVLSFYSDTYLIEFGLFRQSVGILILYAYDYLINTSGIH